MLFPENNIKKFNVTSRFHLSFVKLLTDNTDHWQLLGKLQRIANDSKAKTHQINSYPRRCVQIRAKCITCF